MRLNQLPVESVISIGRQLGEERSLGTPVSLAEGMQRIYLGKIVGKAIYECFAIQIDQVALVGERGEYFVAVRLDVLGHTEEGGFGERHRSQLSRPLVQVAEEVAVDPLEMSQVETARQWLGRKA